MGIGEEPVGRPRTKGFSAVGSKSFILKVIVHKTRDEVVVSKSALPFANVIRDVCAHSSRVISNNKTCRLKLCVI